MLEKIREGAQGTWAAVILGLVILSFVFAGVGSYVSSSGSVAAADVNGEEISLVTLDRAYENERSRLQAQYGDAFAAQMADAEFLNQFRSNILERLIGEKLIEQTANDLGLRVSDQQIREQILQMPEFQIGGQFNNDRFQAALRQIGFQPTAFRDYMRIEMTRQQVARALLGSEFALPSEAQQLFALQEQKRNIRYLSVPAAPFVADVEVTDEQIQEYYQQNLALFDSPEQVSLAYVEFSANDLKKDITVTEQELQDRYAQSGREYRTEEQRRVSHILVEFGEDEDAAEQRAAQLLSRVQQGEDFAALAAQESADTFSAENGGDLDFFGRDVMDPAFETAAFALNAIGDVSEVVKSEFGFHIIKLTDIKPEQVIPFEEVREQLAEAVKTDKAIEEFFIIRGKMAELAFEVVDSLEEVAAAANVEVKSTELFDRNTVPQAVDYPSVVVAAFSDELVNDRVNSEVIEVEENHVIVARVLEHNPERTKSLDEVKEQILAQLTADKAQEAAKQWAGETLTALQAGEDVAERLAAHSLAWQEQTDLQRFGSTVPAAVVTSAFQLPATEGQNAEVVELASGGAAVVQVLSIAEAQEAPAEQLQALQQRLASAKSQASYVGLIEALRADADIEIYTLR